MGNNILFIENSLLPSRGGVEKVTFKLSELFKEKGYNCFFAYKYVDYEGIESNKKIKIDINESKYSLTSRIKSFIETNNINIIILQGIVQGKIIYLLGKLKKLFNLKIIFCLHNTPSYIFFQPPIKKVKIRIINCIKYILYGFNNIFITEHKKIYNICDYYIVLSHYFIDEAINIFHFPDKNKIRSITNPLSISKCNNVDISKKAKEVIIISRFDENQKNILGALNIWKKVNSYCNDWKLKIIGYGDYECIYREYISNNNIGNVEILGKTENPEVYYKNASIFMMTSRYEGLAITLIEALQYSCVPIVYNSFSSVHDIIENEVNGIIIPAFQEDIYINKLVHLMQDQSYLHKLMSKSEMTLYKFNEETIINDWINILNN